MKKLMTCLLAFIGLTACGQENFENTDVEGFASMMDEPDVVVLAQLSDFAQRDPAAPVFDIERAYHGMDDDGPTPISDLSLREVVP